MRIETENNMRYDDNDPRCSCRFCYSQGQAFAFVQALDLGIPHARYAKPQIKCYWGKWDPENPEFSMKEILLTGGKWPDLHVLLN